MTPERLQQIEAVYEQADSTPAADREGLLDRLCAGDAELRREVEQLLAGNGAYGGFMQDVLARPRPPR